MGWGVGVGGGGGGLRCPGYHATTCSERVLAGTCCVIKDRFLRVSQVRPSAHSGAVVGSDFVTSVCRTCNRPQTQEVTQQALSIVCAFWKLLAFGGRVGGLGGGGGD